MSTQHTTGPWQVNHADRTQVCDSDGDVAGCAPIAYIARRNARGRGEDYANTRLSAAAPDMLAALKFALRDMEAARAQFESHAPGVGILAVSIAQVRAAIAKVEGRAS
jgi:hypothetical protein